jgi:hypothetical protein
MFLTCSLQLLDKARDGERERAREESGTTIKPEDGAGRKEEKIKPAPKATSSIPNIMTSVE